MIPAILALPLVQGIVGSVVGGVVNSFAPDQSSSAAAPTASTKTFAPMLEKAASTAAHTLSSGGMPSGTMLSSDWSQMSDSDLKTWTSGLNGRHIDATDETGRTISGTVNGIQVVGQNLALNVSGHLVSLSQLKQISWSPATV
jgi:hypothetical protein